MVDYYSNLLRAVTAPGAGDAQWRRGIYDRARQMLARRQGAAAASADGRARRRTGCPGSGDRAGRGGSDMRRHASATDAGNCDDAAADTTRCRRTPAERDNGPLAAAVAIRAGPLDRHRGRRRGAWRRRLYYLVEVAQSRARRRSPQRPAAQQRGEARAAPPTPQRVARREKDGEPAARRRRRIDRSGSALCFRRQPTFYRTLQPVGSIIVDKLQHFLYLIQPNNVALRYGIGLGEQCTDLAGLPISRAWRNGRRGSQRRT